MNKKIFFILLLGLNFLTIHRGFPHPVPSVTPYLNSIRSEGDFKDLMKSRKVTLFKGKKKVSYVKWTLRWGPMKKGQRDGRIYFQNTQQYPSRVKFMKEKVPNAKNVSVQELKASLLKPWKNRPYTMGMLYYDPLARSDLDSSDFGLAGFALVQKGNPELTRSLRQKERILEIEKTYQVLLKNLPLVSRQQLYYVFNTQRDFFRDRKLLDKLKIPSTFMNAFLAFQSGQEGPWSYTQGDVQGVLRTISLKDFYQGRYQSEEILLLESSEQLMKNFWPKKPFKGLMTSMAISPLSQLSLYTMMNERPFIFIPAELIQQMGLRKLSQQMIQLNVKERGYFTWSKMSEGEKEGEKSEKNNKQEGKQESRQEGEINLQNQVILMNTTINPSEFKQVYGEEGVAWPEIENRLQQGTQSLIIPYYYSYQHWTQALVPEVCERAAFNLDKSNEMSSQQNSILKKLCLDVAKQGELESGTTIWDFLQKIQEISEGPWSKNEREFLKEVVLESPLHEDLLKKIDEIFFRVPLQTNSFFLRSSSHEGIWADPQTLELGIKKIYASTIQDSQNFSVNDMLQSVILQFNLPGPEKVKKGSMIIFKKKSEWQGLVSLEMEEDKPQMFQIYWTNNGELRGVDELKLSSQGFSTQSHSGHHKIFQQLGKKIDLVMDPLNERYWGEFFFSPHSGSGSDSVSDLYLRKWQGL